MLDLSTAATTFKALTGVAQRVNDLPLQAQILELQSTLLDLVSQNLGLVQLNADLRRELAELHRAANQREQMEFEDNAYWRATEEGRREGPFCPKCLDGSHKPVRLLVRGDDHCWRCPVCDAIIAKPGPNPYSRRDTSDFNAF